MSDDDADLFRRSVGKVHPMRNDRVEGRPAGGPPPNRPATPARPRTTLPEPFPGGDGPAPEDSLSHAVPGLPSATLARLRRGRFPVEARLDLHGATAARAAHLLEAFLDAAGRRGQRCVHIVHGKGYRSPDGRPVLKGRVAAWLHGRADVLAYVSATPADGGTGAMYVLLRRGKAGPSRGPPGV